MDRWLVLGDFSQESLRSTAGSWRLLIMEIKWNNARCFTRVYKPLTHSHPLTPACPVAMLLGLLGGKASLFGGHKTFPGGGGCIIFSCCYLYFVEIWASERLRDVSKISHQELASWDWGRGGTDFWKTNQPALWTVYSTHHTTHPSKVSNSMVFSIFTELCNQDWGWF